ncbi:endonuclease-reverse transcriptase domain-containing protein [Hirsutella rhossiliensis]
MNDEELKDCAVLAIAEPYARKKDGMIVTAPMGHSSWSRILPTQTNEAGWPVRSMLWIRKDIDSEQVPIPSSDLTAAVLHLPDRDVLVMSVYVQGKDEEALILTTTELGGLITRFRNGTGKRTDVVLAGDFNRHDLLWGGDCVTSRRQGEGQPIIDLMNEHGLCSLLPRGTKTWQGPDKESTIDLMLVSTELADDMVKCAIHPAEYGSDHRAIHTAFDIDLPERDLTPRLLLRNAPWTAIRNRVEQELRPISWDGSLQDQTDRFMEVHWDDFLADDGNIWRAAKYLKAGMDCVDNKVPQLKRENGTVTKDKQEQAEELLSAFFPPLPDAIEPEHEGPQRAPVPMPELTMEEIERKVMTAKPWKAPGDDGLPAMQWRMAKIIPLKKPGKDDYTAARAWRPISLLSTLGKILEAVMAERISFAVETFGLLPTNHFGARKRRSAEQALVLLQEKIYKAWRMGKASTTARSEGFARELVSKSSHKQVFPGIAAFADSLSFFNADLVQTKISTSGGSIAFVDDYSAWVTGSTAESNRDGIQSIIDRALEWEKRSGATFEGDKTTIIHFTRMAERSSSSPFVIKGRTIWPQENAKVLGVVMDAKLRYKEHMARAASKGLETAMQLKRLRGLSPRVARQLFTAAVAPAMDYASTAVTGAFRTVSTAVAEAEASIRPVRKALSSRRAHPKGEA